MEGDEGKRMQELLFGGSDDDSDDDLGLGDLGTAAGDKSGGDEDNDELDILNEEEDDENSNAGAPLIADLPSDGEEAAAEGTRVKDDNETATSAAAANFKDLFGSEDEEEEEVAREDAEEETATQRYSGRDDDLDVESEEEGRYRRSDSQRYRSLSLHASSFLIIYSILSSILNQPFIASM